MRQEERWLGMQQLDRQRRKGNRRRVQPQPGVGKTTAIEVEQRRRTDQGVVDERQARVQTEVPSRESARLALLVE